MRYQILDHHLSEPMTHSLLKKHMTQLNSKYLIHL